mgnify:CR=1 FL=1
MAIHSLGTAFSGKTRLAVADWCHFQHAAGMYMGWGARPVIFRNPSAKQLAKAVSPGECLQLLSYETYQHGRYMPQGDIQFIGNMAKKQTGPSATAWTSTSTKITLTRSAQHILALQGWVHPMFSSTVDMPHTMAQRLYEHETAHAASPAVKAAIVMARSTFRIVAKSPLGTACAMLTQLGGLQLSKDRQYRRPGIQESFCFYLTWYEAAVEDVDALSPEDRATLSLEEQRRFRKNREHGQTVAADAIHMMPFDICYTMWEAMDLHMAGLEDKNACSRIDRLKISVTQRPAFKLVRSTANKLIYHKP